MDLIKLLKRLEKNRTLKLGRNNTRFALYSWGKDSFKILKFSLVASIFLLAAEPIHGFVHEFFGHGLFSLYFGQVFNSIYLSPFGIQASFETSSLNPPVLAMQYISGSLISIAVGFFIFFILYPYVSRRSFGSAIFFLFLVINFETDMLYPFLSPLIGYGDLNNLSELLAISPRWISSLFVAPLAVIGFYPVIKEYYTITSSTLGEKTGVISRIFFILEIVFLPALILDALSMIFLVLFSGFQVAYFVSTAYLIGLIPLIPAVLLVFSKNKTKDKVSLYVGEDIFRSLRKYIIFSILIILIVIAIFGPTYESRWGLTW